MRKVECPGEDGIIIDLIKEGKECFAKMLLLLFSRCLEKCDVPEDLNNAVMVLLTAKGRTRTLKITVRLADCQLCIKISQKI